MSRKSTSNG
jgi:hypothetical protein